jgi:hypothetical protein
LQLFCPTLYNGLQFLMISDKFSHQCFAVQYVGDFLFKLSKELMRQKHNTRHDDF